MAGPAEHLVGRRPEIALFEQALSRLEQGAGGALALVGEPGIGKTRLLADLEQRAVNRGYVVLAGSGSDFESDVPFGVFIDAMDDYLRSLAPSRLAPLGAAGLAELATVFPALANLAADSPVALAQERYRSYRAVRELLEVLAGQQPLVVILDDVHWADPGSFELLTSLLGRPPAAPVLLALAQRPRQVPERFAIALGRAQRSGSLARAELVSLTLEEARTLLADSGDHAALYEQSGGNPFYLEQLARVRERPGARSSGAAGMTLGEGVPAGVLSALAEELALLSPEARRVLDGASVAGDPFEPELAAAAAAVEDSVTLEALNELLEFDLIRHTELPRRFRFRHPLLRRAVYESTPGGWRLAAHGRAAVTLADLGASAAARAHHIEFSARRGDAAAIAALTQAGQLAAERTPASAARWFAAALRLVGDDGDAGERIRLLQALAAAQSASGQLTDARATLLAALDAAPDDATQRTALMVACAGAEQLLGQHDNAAARLRGAYEALDNPASPEGAGLLISLAVDAYFRGSYDSTRDWSLRAYEVADGLGLAPLKAAGLSAAAIACAFDGSTEQAEQYRAQAAALVDAMTDTELAQRLDTMGYLTGAEAYLDRFDASMAHGRRALRIARATGQGDLLPVLIQAVATALVANGKLAEASELLDGSIEAARLAGHDQTLAWSLLNRSIVTAQFGSLDAAFADARESDDLTRRLDDSVLRTFSGGVLAVLHHISGRHGEAVTLLLECGGGSELALIPGGWRANYLDFLTRSLIELGRLDEAEAGWRRAQEVADRTQLGMARAWERRSHAALRLAGGHPADAAELALASASGFDAAGAVIEAALSRLVAAKTLVALGEPDRAAAELERAADDLGRCGAHRSLHEAESELRKLGRTVTRRTRKGHGEGVFALTGRELELARLVADRRTNAEIASRLFLSPKTVEAHLTNIYRKLGINSRVALARAVEELDRE